MLLDVYKELYRVVKPGGKVRLCVPDFEQMIDCYHKGKLVKHPTPPEYYPRTRLARLMVFGSHYLGVEREDHHHCRRMSYDYDTMRWYLEEAGFANVTKRKHNECSDEFIGRDLGSNKKFVMYVEARKSYYILVEGI